MGAERIAKDIDEQGMPNYKAVRNKKSITKIPRQAIARIIGKDGRNRQDIEETYRVQTHYVSATV